MLANGVEAILSSDPTLLATAKRCFERGDTEKSLEACLAHLAIHPDDLVAVRLKANVLGMDGKLAEAIQAITQVIEQKTPSEPCDFFYRGRWLLRNGQIESACADFRAVLELSAKYDDLYYVGTANLHLAYAYAVSGNKIEAEKILSQLDDECVTSINDTVVTKDYIQKLLDQTGQARNKK